MSKLLYGVGINDAEHQTQKKGEGYICPVFLKWRNMLQRCYSKNKYANCTVCESWKTYSNFENWVITLGVDLHNKDLHLDKDLFGEGDLYSPETCCFLPSKVNTFLVRSLDGVKGTSFHKNRGKFVTQIKNPFTHKTEYLGYSETREEGNLKWKVRKYEILEQLIKEYPLLSERIKNQLRIRI